MSIMQINDYKKDSAIVVLSRLVLKNEIGETFVKSSYDNNNIVIMPVTIGKQQGEIVEIISDLPEGTCSGPRENI